MKNYTPKYISLYESGELDSRIQILNEKLKRCEVCPHHCKEYNEAVKYGEKLGLVNQGTVLP